MIKEININDIIINYQNPRHATPMSNDEIFVMQKLLETGRDINKMYELICNIYKNGFFEESIITVVFDEKTNKYIAWDGNRRVTALKILQNPKLANSFDFSKRQVTVINDMSNKVDKSLFNINCSIKDDFQSLAQYILAIHTNISAGLSWSPQAKDRFEHIYGNKNKSIFQVFYEEFPEIMGKGKIKLSVFERIIGSKPCKDFLQYKIENNALIYKISYEEFKTRLNRIVNDILSNSINTRNMNTVSNISEYLNNTTSIISKTNPGLREHKEKIEDISNNETAKKNIDNSQTNLFLNNIADKNIKSNNSSLAKDGKNIDPTVSSTSQINVSSINNQKKKLSQLLLPGNVKSRINGGSGLHFKYITCNSVADTQDNLGLLSLAREIKRISKSKDYFKYPIATALLIRTLLELSLKFYFINKLPTHWINIQNNCNNRDIGLSDILKYIKKYDPQYSNLFGDKQFSRLWASVFDNTGLKEGLDLITHQIDKVIPDGTYIKSISNSGLYRIIYFFLNS